MKITMLAADHGDCLWVEYGEGSRPKRILIDAGTPGTYERALRPRIAEVIRREGRCRFELIVITHIDADHIGGAVPLFEDLAQMGVSIGEIWFNGWYHLSNRVPDELGAVQAEKLTALIRDGGWRWNARFGRRAVMVPEEGPLPRFTVRGMRITLLSPTFEGLKALKPVWDREIAKAGLVPGDAYEVLEPDEGDGFLGDDLELLAGTPFSEDAAEANGASIAFIAEYDGRRVLFGADAHPSVLMASLSRARLADIPPEQAAFKLPHHASKRNVSNAVVQSFPAGHYLISTSGAQFRHPDEAAIARVLVAGVSARKHLHFNYDSACNHSWRSRSLQAQWQYDAEFGSDGELEVEF